MEKTTELRGSRRTLKEEEKSLQALYHTAHLAAAAREA